MRAFLSNLSIRSKILLPTGGATLLAVIFMMVYFPANYKAGLLGGLEAKALSVGRLMANGVAPALEFGDQSLALEVMNRATGDEDLVYVAVLRDDGTAFADYNPNGAEVHKVGAWSNRATVIQAGGMVVVMAPVQSAGGVRGTVVAGFSTGEIRDEAKSNLNWTLLGGLLIFMVVLGATTLGANYVQRRIASLNNIARQVAETALQVNVTATQILAGSQSQERGATEQSTAVDETRRTMDSLLESGKEITKASQDVLANAERTQRNTEIVGQRISELTTHSQRIAEILEVIKDIANKSELLALNAALEGTKAGEAGRGFSLVATQMQRLAENVKRSVRDIKGLTVDIREATNATVLAMEEGAKVIADTTRSSRQISLIIQQQQSGTEQVSQAMDDVAQIAQQTAIASREAVEAIRSLTELAERLETLVAEFQPNRK